MGSPTLRFYADEGEQKFTFLRRFFISPFIPDVVPHLLWRTWVGLLIPVP